MLFVTDYVVVVVAGVVVVVDFNTGKVVPASAKEKAFSCLF